MLQNNHFASFEAIAFEGIADGFLVAILSMGYIFQQAVHDNKCGPNRTLSVFSLHWFPISLQLRKHKLDDTKGSHFICFCCLEPHGLQSPRKNCNLVGKSLLESS